MTMLRDEYPYGVDVSKFHEHVLPTKQVMCAECRVAVDIVLLEGRVLESAYFWNEEKNCYEIDKSQRRDYNPESYVCGTCYSDLANIEAVRESVVF